MKVVVTTRQVRTPLNRFVPTAVQVVANFIPFKMRPAQPTPRTVFRPLTHTVLQTVPVITPLPIRTRGMIFNKNPFVQNIHRPVLSTGPAAFIPIRSARKCYYAPARPQIMRRSVIFQQFVPAPSPPRVHMLALPTRRVRCPYPIQPNILPIRTMNVRYIAAVRTRPGRIVPLAAPPPIVLTRFRQRSMLFPVAKQPRSIIYNTPATVVPRNRIQHVLKNGTVRNITRFVPAAVQQVPVFCRPAPHFVPVPKFGLRSRSLIFQGPTTTVQAPIFVGGRTRLKVVNNPIRRPVAVIAAPQAVIVVRSVKTRVVQSAPRRQGFPFAVSVTSPPVFIRPRVQHIVINRQPRRPVAMIQAPQPPQAVVVVRAMRLYPLPATPRRNGFPFAVDRPVTVNVPFPIASRLPRWVRIPYPRLQRFTVAAFPPPIVQPVLLTNRRVVR